MYMTEFISASLNNQWPLNWFKILANTIGPKESTTIRQMHHVKRGGTLAFIFTKLCMLSTLYKIIGVCPQIFDSIIHDWLEPPQSLESPQPKRVAVKPPVEKSEMVFLFQVMPLGGKEQDGVPILGDAIELSHSMC